MTIKPATELLLFILIWPQFPRNKLKKTSSRERSMNNEMFIQLAPHNNPCPGPPHGPCIFVLLWHGHFLTSLRPTPTVAVNYPRKVNYPWWVRRIVLRTVRVGFGIFGGVLNLALRWYSNFFTRFISGILRNQWVCNRFQYPHQRMHMLILIFRYKPDGIAISQVSLTGRWCF